MAAVETPAEHLATKLDTKLLIGPQRSRLRYIIAIDYGTTFSAISYATYKADPEKRLTPAGFDTLIKETKPKVVRKYPSASNRVNLPYTTEVATISMYPNGSNENYAWGNGVFRAWLPSSNVPANTPILEYVKLLLSNTPGTEERRKQTSAVLKACGVHAVKAIADFLRELWKYANEYIFKEASSLFRDAQKDLVISVPACWGPEALRTMMRAATMAGIPTPVFVSEPEAAALQILIDRGTDDLDGFDVGVSCTLC